MGLWINQTLKLDDQAEIELRADLVSIGAVHDPDREPYQPAAVFFPTSRAHANQMSVALKMAAKRLEDIGKGMD